MQRASSPYRAPSPYGHESPYPAHQLPSGTAQVGPGSVTYTTSAGSDGRVVYHPFKAVAASYQTPSGVVSGIQWVPAEATTTLPPGAIPASGEYAGNWHGNGYAHKEEHKSTQDWQRTDEKRRKQEEKEAKRMREQGPPRNDSDYELRMARERDAQSSVGRERRKSFVGGAGPPASVAFPTGPATNTGYPTHPTVSTGYPTSTSYSNYGSPNVPQYGAPIYPVGATGHSRNPSSGGYDIARQMGDMDLKGERERKVSGRGHARKHSTNEAAYERTRTTSGTYPDRDRASAYASPPGYASSGGYGNHKGANPYPSHYSSASPNIRPSEIPYGTAGSTGYPGSGSNYTSSPSRHPTDISRSTTPFGQSSGGYPPGHVLHDAAANPGPRSRAASRAGSRAPSPNPGSYSTNASPHLGKSPHISSTNIPAEPQQLPAPEAFSRPLNAANSFAPFDPIRIQDMDDVYDAKLPKMPTVLSTHDIFPEDWKRCMQDLARSWTGQLPVAGGRDGRPPRRSKLAQDLVELWNASFFQPRGIEMILYKGKERRTGPQAGILEPALFGEDDDDSSTTTTTDSEASDYDSRVPGGYGRPAYNVDAQRRRHEERQERRKRRKEKKARRKAKAQQKTYSVFVSYLRGGPPAAYGTAAPGSYVPAMASPPGGFIPPGTGYSAPPTGYGAAPAGYGPPPAAYSTPSPYGAPIGIPTSRSHGYGGGY